MKAGLPVRLSFLNERWDMLLFRKSIDLVSIRLKKVTVINSNTRIFDNIFGLHLVHGVYSLVLHIYILALISEMYFKFLVQGDHNVVF